MTTPDTLELLTDHGGRVVPPEFKRLTAKYAKAGR